MNKWQLRWSGSEKGRWAHSLIPGIAAWIKTPHGEADYFLTQALSGHGCYRSFLYKRKRADSDTCIYCGAEDDVHHTLFACEKWAAMRQKYESGTRTTFDMNTVTRCLVGGRDECNSMYTTMRYIIQNKEQDLREAAV